MKTTVSFFVKMSGYSCCRGLGMGLRFKISLQWNKRFLSFIHLQKRISVDHVILMQCSYDKWIIRYDSMYYFSYFISTIIYSNFPSGRKRKRKSIIHSVFQHHFSPNFPFDRINGRIYGTWYTSGWKRCQLCFKICINENQG